jgi:CheY-like chemotaxis protein
MLRIVTTNNVEVFRHLGGGPFQRLDVSHEIATSAPEALAKVRALRPQIAIIDAELADGSGYEVCRAIKQDPSLADVHVMLVLSAVISRPELASLRECGCDDVLAVPVHADEFYHHIAQIAGLPLRRERRVAVALEVELELPGEPEPRESRVDNVSSGGAGVTVEGRLTTGQRLLARFEHEGMTYPEVPATVAWVRPARDPAWTAAGIVFADLPIKTRLLLERLCQFDVATNAEGGVTVSLFGDITEVTVFDTLSQRLARESKIDFYMRAVRYISSAGVRSWCNFLNRLPAGSYSFRHCSTAFVSQAAMVPMALGSGPVLSLEAPYRCDDCDRDDVRLVETGSLMREGGHVTPPTLKCASCGGELEFDDVPDRYFAFLRGAD